MYAIYYRLNTKSYGCESNKTTDYSLRDFRSDVMNENIGMSSHDFDSGMKFKYQTTSAFLILYLETMEDLKWVF